MSNKGFTIIEMLISASILSIMIVAMTVAFQQQQRHFNITKEAVDMDQTARSVIDYIASEIRNSSARQGKTFSLSFTNGGSTTGLDPDDPCGANTASAGTKDSEPDCLTIYTWDITKGQYTDATGKRIFPSSMAPMTIVSQGPPLVIQLPQEWFTKPDGTPFTPPLIEAGDFLGFRSRINLCHPDTNVDCGATPTLCTECATVLEVSSVNVNNKTATINDDSSLIKAHNSNQTYSTLSNFVSNFILPTISSQSHEMTLVSGKTFRVDPETRAFEISENGEDFETAAGGFDAPGIVDIQYVFNLQNPDGSITKVGVAPAAADNRFSDFSDATLVGREQDIRSVEIYVVVKSKIKPVKIQGGYYRKNIPAVGDVTIRTVANPSDYQEPEEGFAYKVFSAVVYVRNFAREEFG